MDELLTHQVNGKPIVVSATRGASQHRSRVRPCAQGQHGGKSPGGCQAGAAVPPQHLHCSLSTTAPPAPPTPPPAQPPGFAVCSSSRCRLHLLWARLALVSPLGCPGALSTCTPPSDPPHGSLPSSGVFRRPPLLQRTETTLSCLQ